MNTQDFAVRGFQILSIKSSITGEENAGICKFLYKGKQISITASKDAQEIAIYGKNNFTGDYSERKGVFFVVEDAIKFIDAIELLTSFQMHAETLNILKEVFTGN